MSPPAHPHQPQLSPLPHVQRRRETVHRLVILFWMVMAVNVAGTIGYMLLERYRFIEALYMTAITTSTVGFAEVRELSDSGRLFTVALIVVSLGIIGYTLTTLGSFIIDGELLAILKGRRMDRHIARLRNHIIVCGCGNTGSWIVQELRAVNADFVIIDHDEAACVPRRDGPEMLSVVGDATEDAVLEAAGIEHARGLVAALSDDKDNIFLAITARGLNPRLRIIGRVVNEDNIRKLIKAGTDHVISPDRIGGMRMASAMIRPAVVEFLDRMLYSQQAVLRFEEVTVPDAGPLAGVTLAQSDIGRRTGALVVAIRQRDSSFTFNPSGSFTLQPGLVLICLGTVEQVQALREMV